MSMRLAYEPASIQTWMQTETMMRAPKPRLRATNHIEKEMDPQLVVEALRQKVIMPRSEDFVGESAKTWIKTSAFFSPLELSLARSRQARESAPLSPERVVQPPGTVWGLTRRGLMLPAI